MSLEQTEEICLDSMATVCMANLHKNMPSYVEENVSTIANISVSSLLYVDVVKSTIDGDRFYDYV